MIEYLRCATGEDIDLLFEWVNDEEVRKVSFSTDMILYSEHKKWFFNLLKSENCKQYIYCVDDEPVGQVRITIDGNKAGISYSICAAKRGNGYCKRMLRLVMLRIKEDFPQIRTLVAQVKPENRVSSKIFLELGYEEIYRQYEINI